METEKRTYVEKALSYVGFAARSGKLAAGTDQVLTEVRRASSRSASDGIAVLLATDASDRTKKQVRDKCAFYKVSLFEITCSDELSRAAGKKGALSAICITDKNLVAAVINTLKETDGKNQQKNG